MEYFLIEKLNRMNPTGEFCFNIQGGTIYGNISIEDLKVPYGYELVGNEIIKINQDPYRWTEMYLYEKKPEFFIKMYMSIKRFRNFIVEYW